jgi:hypothetical protein
VLHQQTLRASREFGESNNLFRLFKLRATSCLFCLFNFWCLFFGSLSTALRSKFFFLINHGLNSVVHVLNKLCLASAESSLVRNIIDMIVSLGMLSVGTSNLDVIFVCNGLENIFLLSKVREKYMDRSSKGSSKISWA